MGTLLVSVGVLAAIALLFALVLAPLKLYSIDNNLASIASHLEALSGEVAAARTDMSQQTQFLGAISRNVLAMRGAPEPRDVPPEA